MLGLLKRLPLPDDPLAPLFKRIGESLVEGLRRLSFVPGDEAWKKPSAARILEEDLVPLFSPEEMTAAFILAIKSRGKDEGGEYVGCKNFPAMNAQSFKFSGKRRTACSRLHQRKCRTSRKMPMVSDLAFQGNHCKIQGTTRN